MAVALGPPAVSRGPGFDASIHPRAPHHACACTEQRPPKDEVLSRHLNAETAACAAAGGPEPL